MGEIIVALRRSLASFGRGKIWLYILVPALIAIVLMVGLSIALLDYLITSFIAQPPMSWFAEWGAEWLAKAMAALGGWLLILSASYAVAILLTALLVLPLMLNYLAERDYPDLARLGRDSFIESVRNSVGAAVLFAVGWVITLPLWLIPGVGLLLPLAWLLAVSSERAPVGVRRWWTGVLALVWLGAAVASAVFGGTIVTWSVISP